MEQQELFGKLFKTIPLYTEEHLEFILQTLNKEDAITMLIHAVKSAYDSGHYTLGESEILSKSIRILSKKDSTDLTNEEKELKENND